MEASKTKQTFRSTFLDYSRLEHVKISQCVKSADVQVLSQTLSGDLTQKKKQKTIAQRLDTESLMVARPICLQMSTRAALFLL